MEVTVLRPLVIAGKPTLPLPLSKNLHLLRLSLPLRLPHLSSSSTSRLTSPSLFFSLCLSIATVSKFSSNNFLLFIFVFQYYSLHRRVT